MAKGHVTPHNMLARTQWQQPGLPPQDMRHTRFSGFQRGPQGVPKQSPRGQKLLKRSVPPSAHSLKVIPTSARDAQAVTVAAVPYYDPKMALPFVARFGSADGGLTGSKVSWTKLLKLTDSQVLKLARFTGVAASLIWGAMNLAAVLVHDRAIELSIQQERWPFFESPHSLAVATFANILVMLCAYVSRVDEINRQPDSEDAKRRKNNEKDYFISLTAIGMIALVEWPVFSEVFLLTQGLFASSDLAKLVKAWIQTKHIPVGSGK